MNILISQLIGRARNLKRQGRFSSVFRIYRLLRDFYEHVKSACQFPIYFLLVAIRFPWFYPYFWMGRRLRSKLGQLIESDSFQKNVADDLYHRAIGCLEKASQLNPDFVEAAQSIGQAALVTGRIDEWIKAQYRAIRYQEKRAQNSGAASQNIRIIEGAGIFSTIGATLPLDAWIKSGLLGFRPPCSSLVLVEPALKAGTANQCLLDYWRSYFEFVEDSDKLTQLRPLARDLSARLDYIPCGDRTVPYAISASVWIQAEWEKQGRQPLLQLKDEHKQRGWEMLARMGIPKDAWFVTTHVRESGFKGKESFRDSDIVTYLKSFRQVTERGGWVIRLGDASMDPLPAMPQVIDYALSSVKSDWMDVFLLAAARFMIGTSSGPASVSYAFGVPVAMTNYLPAAAVYFTRQDLFLPRLMRRIDDRSFLNLEALMTLPYSMGACDGMYKNIFRVEAIPNTSEEISGLVTEMLDKLDGTLRYTEKDESLQKRFKSLTAEREVIIGLPGFEIQCRLGRDFLRHHQHLLAVS